MTDSEGNAPPPPPPPPPRTNSGGAGNPRDIGVGSPGNNQRYKKKRVPKSIRKVRKVVPKSARKATGKGYRRVKKNVVVKPVKKFQNTTLGQRIAPRDKCSTPKICSYVFAVLILIASSIGLIIATGNADTLTSIVENVAPNLDLTNLDDPFAGGKIRGIWPVTSKNGLNMEILNALDETWQAVFQLAVSEWENPPSGNPKSLIITKTAVTYDEECTPVDGRIKICNGDYGNKPWRGLATCTLQDDDFVHCSAKMNDYYLKNGGNDVRQYTMCHELGHGFGLQHTDEEFGNANKGNCLDYTEDFATNLSPDSGNYDKLAEFYGSIGGRRRLRRRLRRPTTDTLKVPFKQDEEDNEESSKSTTITQNKAESPIFTPTPDHIWEKRKTVLDEFESLVSQHGVNSNLLAKYGWKVVEDTLMDAEHQIDLGDGYTLEVQISAPLKDGKLVAAAP